jgi:hypothetical protein
LGKWFGGRLQLRGMGIPIQMFCVEEDGQEIHTGAAISGVARIWSERPNTRRVYQVAPTGPSGTLEKICEVAADDLAEALKVRIGYGPLQPDLFQPGSDGGRECGGVARRGFSQRERHRACLGNACSGIHGWRAGGSHADAPPHSPAGHSTSGGECPCSASAAYSCEAAARA